MKKEIGVVFIFLAVIALLLGLLWGSVAAFQFVYPGFFDAVPFFKMRPLHVSFVVSWIFLSAIGGIYYYLTTHFKIQLFSRKMAVAHAWVFCITGALITACYLSGKFGGREYWEFPAILAIPVFISWVLFGVNYFKTIVKRTGAWPVYLWMWGTGICFFLFTFSESYLWLFPYFRNNIVRDLTVQWKAYGALVGSWNMLVYGTAMFVMEKVKGDTRVAHSRLAFAMFFLGLANLMFGWAHHLYIVPTAPWIRYLSYAISMSELLIFAKIIFNWKKGLSEARRDFYFIPYRFLVASNLWIFLNLTLALIISIPAINIFTHGTHITVAHAMGSAIGINTMILLASVLLIIGEATGHTFSTIQKKTINAGFWITNISLFLFCLCLILAGIEKGKLVIENQLTFQAIMEKIRPWLVTFAFAGLGIFTGLLLVTVHPMLAVVGYLKRKKSSEEVPAELKLTIN
jgi:nitric oxide reductase subunit B